MFKHNTNFPSRIHLLNSNTCKSRIVGHGKAGPITVSSNRRAAPQTPPYTRLHEVSTEHKASIHSSKMATAFSAPTLRLFLPRPSFLRSPPPSTAAPPLPLAAPRPGRRAAMIPPLRAASSVPPKWDLQWVLDLIRASPATWESAIFNNVLIFLVGLPLLVAGLSFPGIVAAFLLGTLTWRALGLSGFLLVATYFVIVGQLMLLMILSYIEIFQKV